MFVCPFNCTLANIYTVYKLAPPESMQTSIHPVANVWISSHVIVWNLMSESAPHAFCQQTILENFNRINASPYSLDLIFRAAVRISSVARFLPTPVWMRAVPFCQQAPSHQHLIHMWHFCLLVNRFNSKQKGADASHVWIYLFQCVLIMFV